MAVAAKKQSKPDLASEIWRIRAEVDAFIDSKTVELKRSADGASQPIQALRNMLTRNNSCLCRAGLRLLGEPDA
jgi:hypothetical protein